MNAAAWFAQQSFHQHLPEPEKAPKRILEMTIEQWEGTRFVERLVLWDDEDQVYRYAEATR